MSFSNEGNFKVFRRTGKGERCDSWTICAWKKGKRQWVRTGKKRRKEGKKKARIEIREDRKG